jgi:hypothetical protein
MATKLSQWVNAWRILKNSGIAKPASLLLAVPLSESLHHQRLMMFLRLPPSPSPLMANVERTIRALDQALALAVVVPTTVVPLIFTADLVASQKLEIASPWTSHRTMTPISLYENQRPGRVRVLTIIPMATVSLEVDQ